MDGDVLRRSAGAVQQLGGAAVQRRAGRSVQVGQDGRAGGGVPEAAGSQHTRDLERVEDAGGNRSGDGRVDIEQPREQRRRTRLLQHRDPPRHPQQRLTATAQAGQHRLAERLSGAWLGGLPGRRRAGGGRQILDQRPQQERVAAGEIPPARRRLAGGGRAQPRREYLGHPAHRQLSDPQPVAPRLAQQVGLPGVAQPVSGRIRQLGGDQQHALGPQPPPEIDQPA